jgi:hypothetical protein
VTNIIPPSPVGRYLLLDRDPAAPRWLLVSLMLPDDAWPAVIDGTGSASRYRRWEDATQQVRQRAGEHDVRLVPLDFPTLAWRLDTRTDATPGPR